MEAAVGERFAELRLDISFQSKIWVVKRWGVLFLDSEAVHFALAR